MKEEKKKEAVKKVIAAMTIGMFVRGRAPVLLPLCLASILSIHVLTMSLSRSPSQARTFLLCLRRC